MFRIHNPDYLSELIPWQPDPPWLDRNSQDHPRKPRRIWAGHLQDLGKLSVEQWMELKRKALRPEGSK